MKEAYAVWVKKLKKTHIFKNSRAFCKTEIFVQNQGMRKILPQAYNGYSEDKILSITPSLGEKIVLQMAHQPQVNVAHSLQETPMSQVTNQFTSLGQMLRSSRATKGLDMQAVVNGAQDFPKNSRGDGGG